MGLHLTMYWTIGLTDY